MWTSLSYLLSFSTRQEETTAATPTHAVQFTLETDLKMDSRWDSRNLNSPLASSRLICHRTIKHVTTQPPGIWCITSTNSTAYATQGCSCPALAYSQHWETHLPEPRLSFYVTTQQRNTVLCRARLIQVHPHPRKASRFHFFSCNKTLSSFHMLPSHNSLQNQSFPFNRPGSISKAAN